MSTSLNGKTIAFLVAAEGVEQFELTEPWKAVEPARILQHPGRNIRQGQVIAELDPRMLRRR